MPRLGPECYGVVDTNLDVSYYTRLDTCPFVSGVPLGGLGTGTIEIRADGSFREWQIFNNWGNNQSIAIWEHWPSFDLPNAFLAVRTETPDGKTSAHVLEKQPLFSRQGIKDIRYTGRFPFVELYYTDPALPVSVKLSAFSPFLPHDAPNSARPVIHFSFMINNLTNMPVQVSLMFSIENPFADRSEMRFICGRKTIVLKGVGPGGRNPSGICLVGDGRKVSHKLLAKMNSAEDLWEDFASDGILSDDSKQKKGSRGVLCNSLSIEGGGNEYTDFTLSWFFPDHRENGAGQYLGHMYANWHTDECDVAEYFLKNFQMLIERTRAWHDVVYGSDLPEWLTEMIGNSVSLLAKSSWWTADGRFGIFESFQCPSIECLHVRYPGSVPLALLFPKLDQSVLLSHVRYQLPSGRLYEQFGRGEEPSLKPVSLEIARDFADLVPCFVLMTYRDFIWTGDRVFLDDIWPHVKKTIRYEQTKDVDNDGLPDNVGAQTTYDVWDMGDQSSYVSSLCIASLVAAIRMAEVEDDVEFKEECMLILQKARISMDKKLWNGDFYAVGEDGGKLRESASPDSLSGQWYADLLGLGDILPDEHIDSSVRATLTYCGSASNFGAVNAAKPDGSVDFTGKNPVDNRFPEAIWPGPTFVLSNLAIYRGMVDEGLSLIRKVYRSLTEITPGGLWNIPDVIEKDTGRYHPWFFGHYYRNAAIFSTLFALTGWNYNAYIRKLTLCPHGQTKNLSVPWVSGYGFGSITYQNPHGTDDKFNVEIKVVSGKIEIRFIDLALPDSLKGNNLNCKTECGGEKIVPDYRVSGERIYVTFPSYIRVNKYLKLQLW